MAMTVKEMAQKGGKARAAKMSKQARIAAARKAAIIRWAKEKAK